MKFSSLAKVFRKKSSEVSNSDSDSEMEVDKPVQVTPEPAPEPESQPQPQLQAQPEPRFPPANGTVRAFRQKFADVFDKGNKKGNDEAAATSDDKVRTLFCC